MPKYNIRVRKSYESEFEIEADNVFEAEEKGIELFDNQEIHGYEMLIEESDCERIED